MPKIFHQVGWFIVVGASAALVHWLAAVAIVQLWGANPLLANLFAWLIAFGVSFAGHYNYTFKQEKKRSALPAAARFFGVSACSFLLNELLYFWLLKTTTLPYDILLALVLIIVAFFTFAASRLWAFAR